MFPNRNYGSQQYNSRNPSPQNHQNLPLIRQQSNNSPIKNMLASQYNLPQPQNQIQYQGPFYSQQPYYLNANQQSFGPQIPFYSGQKTSMHSNSSYNLLASNNGSFSNNLGLNQQFQNQQQPINFGFDLSDFGIPNPQPIKYIFRERKQRFRQPQTEEFPADFLDRIPLPKIQKIDHRQNKVKIPILNIRTEFSDDEMGNADAKTIQKTQQEDSKQSQSQIKSVDKKVVQQKIRGPTQSYKPIAMQVVIKKKINFFIKTKIFRIRFIFLASYIRTLRHFIETKRTLQINLMNKISPLASDACNKWLNENLKELLLEIISLKEDLSLVQQQESQNLAKKGKIQSLILRTFQSLSESFNPQTMQKEFFQFLNQIGQSYYFPSQGYYFNFEILRLNFTNFASLGDTNKQQQRMVVILFVFLRNLVFVTFMNARHNQQDQLDNTLSLVKHNFTIISSIIHEIIVQWIGKKVAKINSLDQLIEEKHKVIPRIGPLTDLDKEMKGQFKDNILIDNLLPNNETKKYIFSKLKVREQWVVQLMVLIGELTDKILLQCKLDIDKEKKSSTRERMKVKMFFVDSIPKAIVQKTNKK